uniref:NADH-ubiquinone oxidoreductase chain 2 n=1 Tax=Diplonevra peregrina TaxID=1003499 RepID=A0A7U3QRL6_9MUSC|nr:NADH dehydrogenase subunit 2 [Diplonevra peregrina]QPN53552.1 NADH dehydrogenase subunit 2 [Diplonevra peregrina]
MFKNSYKLLFLFSLMLGTMITISSTTWISAWMGLEINLLSFIPLMSDNKNLMSTESSMKYFLVQAMASSILLFIVIIYMMNSNFYSNFNQNFYFNLLMISTLMMKMGMAPFHFWFPNIIEGLNWINSLILLTWQKIAPLMLLSYMNMNQIIIPMIIISMIISAIGGLNQTSLRKIMVYSSINHMSWMCASMLLNKSIWLNYFIFYSFLSITLIYNFYINKLYYMNQLYSLYNYSMEMKLIFFMNFLSLGGLPPFLGFYPKWMVIELLSNNQLFLISIMVMLTLLTLFFYIRMCYSSFLLNYYEIKWNNMINMNNKHYLYLILSFISIFGLLLMNILYFMF